MSLPENPDEPAGMRRLSSTPDHIELEYDAVVAADQLAAAHRDDEQEAASAEGFVGQSLVDASAADILAAWRASNARRRERMLMTHKRGDNLLAAINIMFALE